MRKEIDQEVGLIGLGVMGQGIALNLTRHGCQAFVYDKDQEKTRKLAERADQTKLHPKQSLSALVDAIKRPRTIMLLVRAGEETDHVIEELVPLLEAGDTIVDLGNSHYQDTEQREARLARQGIRFLGTGISGGEKGAEKGPAIMAGGNESAWQDLKKLFSAIAAPGSHGKPCCDYFGTGGAGHFVKMVHNGIEYGYMEVISEIYLLAKTYYGLETSQMAGVFREFSQDERVSSYLIEITAKILEKIDQDTGRPLIEWIADIAGNKGTGKWTSQAALELGASVPVLTEALYARYHSAEPRQKTQKSQAATGNFDDKAMSELRQALEFGQYLCFENGLKLIQKAATAQHWNMDLAALLETWENGCIIRTRFSETIKHACQRNKGMASLLEDQKIAGILERDLTSAKAVLWKACQSNVPLFCLSAALQYYTAYHSSQLPTVMVQAQRDFFGAHTYQRIDKKGTFHTTWEE